MSKQQRDRVWERVYERDKELVNGAWRIRCHDCGSFGSKSSLVVHHIDNNAGNNELSNLLPLCRRCNYMWDPQGSGSREKPQVAGDDDARSAELRKNQTAEPKFRMWVLAFIRKKGPQVKEIVIDAGAEAAGISPITAARYLKKLCSLMGPLMTKYDDGAAQDFVKFRLGPHANDAVDIDDSSDSSRVLPG